MVIKKMLEVLQDLFAMILTQNNLETRRWQEIAIIR